MARNEPEQGALQGALAGGKGNGTGGRAGNKAESIQWMQPELELETGTLYGSIMLLGWGLMATT